MVCRKKRYRTSLDAMIALSQTDEKAKRRGSHRDETRSYLCPLCRGYHLTSQPQRTQV